VSPEFLYKASLVFLAGFTVWSGTLWAAPPPDAEAFKVIGGEVYRVIEARGNLSQDQLTTLRKVIDDTLVTVSVDPLPFVGGEKAVVDLQEDQAGKLHLTIDSAAFDESMKKGTGFRVVSQSYLQAAGLAPDLIDQPIAKGPTIDYQLRAENQKVTRVNVVPHTGTLKVNVEAPGDTESLIIQVTRGTAAQKHAAFQQLAPRLGSSVPPPVVGGAGAYPPAVVDPAAEIPALIGALQDPDQDVARGASRKLGKLGKIAVGPLIGCLGLPNPKVNELAADALGDIGVDAEPAVDLIRGLYIRYNRKPEWPRTAAASQDALDKIGTPKAKYARSQLQNDKDQADQNVRNGIKEQVFREEASKRGVSVDTIRSWHEAYLRGDKVVVGGPSHNSNTTFRQVLRTSNENLWEWDNGLGTIFWTNPNDFEDPAGHYHRQAYAHYLLTRWGAGGAIPPVHTPGSYSKRR